MGHYYWGDWGDGRDAQAPLRVARIGVDISHPGGFTVDRDTGTDDYTFLHFSTPVELLSLEGKRWEPAGTCILYAPGMPQWYRGRARGFTHDWFHMRGPLADRLPAEYGIPPGRPLYPRDPKPVAAGVQAMLREILARDPYHEKAIALGAQALFLALARGIDPAPPPFHPRKEAWRRRFQGLRAQLRAQPARAWTVEAMARKLGLSPSRFQALYREFFGASPVDDLIGLRLEKARWLLVQGNMNVSQVAAACGFGGLAYFSRIFKRRLGLAPGRYRGEAPSPG